MRSDSDPHRAATCKRVDNPAKSGYLKDGTGMKRIADWLEKISAGAMLIGLFQNNLWAVAIGIGALVGSVYMTRRMQ